MGHQRLDRHVGGPFARGQGADADVHLAVAEREDPAVARQHLVLLVAQLEVGADPRVVGHRRVGVAAPGDAVDGLAVPLPAQQLAERRPHAVGHDEPVAGDLEALAPRPDARPRANSTAATRSPSMRTPTARAPSIASAPALIAVVRRWSSSSVRATAEPQAGRVPPGQGSSSVWPNPWARSPWLTAWARSQSSSPSFCSSPIARGVSPSPHVLSRGNTAASASSTSYPPAPPTPPPPTPPAPRRRRARRCASGRWRHEVECFQVTPPTAESAQVALRNEPSRRKRLPRTSQSAQSRRVVRAASLLQGSSDLRRLGGSTADCAARGLSSATRADSAR